MKIRGKLVISYLWGLSLAISFTIMVAWMIFPLEISWQSLERFSGYTSMVIRHNFNQLMTYLTLPWVPKLAMTDFPSSSGALHHFAEVKVLFLIVEGIVILAGYPVVKWLYQAIKAGKLWLYHRYLAWTAMLPVIFGILVVLIGFDQFFILFHQVLFAGDNTWLFDPSTDPVILILPESFFLHCFVLFFVLYEVFFAGLWLWAKCMLAQALDA